MIAMLRRNIGRVVVTLAMVGCAMLVGQHLWEYYVDAPWTRDGRVSADVVTIASEVSGKVQSVSVSDNQFVHKGDVLFQIDRESFQFALDQASATLEGREQTLKLTQSMASRRAYLRSSGTISAETEEQSRREAAVARAEYQSAKVALDIARLNLSRTTVKAPVDGYITNLHLRPGDYAVAGQTGIAVVEADSFRVTGYFQETQLERIHARAPVNIRLMGFAAPLSGHVESFGKGIADSNSATNAVGLPTVEPVFSWVRLAQRIPVRVHIDQVPDGVVLAAGMSASLYVVE